MITIFISIYLSVMFSFKWYLYLHTIEMPKEKKYDDFFKSVLEDPNFIRVKENIMHFSKTMTRETFHEELAKKIKEKGLIYDDKYRKYDTFKLDFTLPEFDNNGDIIWSDPVLKNNQYNEDLLLYKKVNDMQFIDLNKQAQNEGIQNQNFAEIVYMLEEYISMLHNYPNQVHSVAEVQRKAIFEKFIILKK